MEAIQERTGELWSLLVAHGFEELFGADDVARVECPACNAPRSLKLSLASGQARCSSCGVSAPIRTYLSELEDAEIVREPEFTEAEIIPLRADRAPVPRQQVPPSAERSAAQTYWQAELVEPEERAPSPSRSESDVPVRNRGRHPAETLIIVLLSLVFLAAGLAAAGLSGFANYQAFSASVTDPMQGQIWGWAGVIATVCSFGGFTFFWWHVSGGRRSEGFRALIFALAGAATSILGTSLFMQSSQDERLSAEQAAAAARPVVEAQIADYSRQLEGIPPETRSVEGLEDYLRGVEAAGRTHQKPYRDAQNELGLARRRAELEQKIEAARLSLLGEGGPTVLNQDAPGKGLPAWFFAIMLEVFSSQGTSIALVALLVLASGRSRPSGQELAAA
ncbi:MAG: hypothetical protein RLN72_00635 [Henriciella sp.]